MVKDNPDTAVAAASLANDDDSVTQQDGAQETIDIATTSVTGVDYAITIPANTNRRLETELVDASATLAVVAAQPSNVGSSGGKRGPMETTKVSDASYGRQPVVAGPSNGSRQPVAAPMESNQSISLSIGAETLSDAEYYTPLGSPDESRRSSMAACSIGRSDSHDIDLAVSCCNLYIEESCI